VVKTAHAEKRIPQDQQTPSVSDDVEGVGYRAIQVLEVLSGRHEPYPRESSCILQRTLVRVGFNLKCTDRAHGKGAAMSISRLTEALTPPLGLTEFDLLADLDPGILVWEP
jgi:hypothetical protein